ncbi:hypothetical protein H257_01205 [Aphanomyces astaci]|uniref:Uncharacterized protein n=1 Tax=Aphanomyces astaci TaxID=112090 RepID=W4H771_APHAT|nr:hypothetical protein H257_01205 [Aphanomyces astaci]ETV87732.1 hypothetical protein H257_01205 [Aphanomyces astaci]|eukprot:XP_009822595.1 hypothetical protein H257_01205 [Aphanomyces astaci]
MTYSNVKTYRASCAWQTRASRRTWCAAGVSGENCWCRRAGRLISCNIPSRCGSRTGRPCTRGTCLRPSGRARTTSCAASGTCWLWRGCPGTLCARTFGTAFLSLA